MLLRDTEVHGFQAFIRTWGKRLDAAAALDDFGRKRLNDLINAAGEFDGTGSSSCAATSCVSSTTTSFMNSGTDNAVRVMTVHQSKGLGFDIVILPDLQGNNMARPETPISSSPATPTPAPHWALKMPRS
jgi:ATP-dependent helicase/nuclease subunit A